MKAGRDWPHAIVWIIAVFALLAMLFPLWWFWPGR